MRNTSIQDGAIEPGQHPRVSFRAPHARRPGVVVAPAAVGGGQPSLVGRRLGSVVNGVVVWFAADQEFLSACRAAGSGISLGGV